MVDWTDWVIFGAVRGAEGLLTGGAVFSELRPGGLVRDGKSTSTLERSGRSLRLAAGAGAIELEDLRGVARV